MPDMVSDIFSLALSPFTCNTFLFIFPVLCVTVFTVFGLISKLIKR